MKTKRKGVPTVKVVMAAMNILPLVAQLQGPRQVKVLLEGACRVRDAGEVAYEDTLPVVEALVARILGLS